MGTRIHRNTSSEPLRMCLRRTMRSRQDVLFNFGSFLPNLVAMATRLAPLKFWIAYLKSPTPKSLLTRQICVDILYRNEVMPV